MKNTYNIGLLRRRIFEALPRNLTAMGEAAVEGFLALSGASAWRPDRLRLRELSYVFDIGVPFGLIGDNPSARAHSLRAGEAVRFGRYPDANLWSAVHAAALLSTWGAQVSFVADGGEPQPRLEVQLASGDSVDVEVIRATEAHDAKTELLRPHVLAVDARGMPARDERIKALLDRHRCAAHGSGALLFEPRFWIGIEQKEWLHWAQPKPNATILVAPELLGSVDGHGHTLNDHRHALRVPLLVDPSQSGEKKEGLRT